MTYAEPTTDMDNRKLKTENGKRKARAGFTLIETLVAASIFVMLTTVAVGAFVQALPTISGTSVISRRGQLPRWPRPR